MVEVWFYSADNVANHREVTNVILVGSQAGLVRRGNKIVTQTVEKLPEVGCHDNSTQYKYNRW